MATIDSIKAGTPTVGTINTTATEASTVAELAQQALGSEILEPGKLYAVLNGEGGVDIRDTDHYDVYPRRKTGTYRVESAEAFNRYLTKHHEQGSTEVWADTVSGQIHAVINAPTDSMPGWSDHKVYLDLTKTPEWTAWEARSGKLMDQAAFAEFIEDQAADIMVPSSAEVLELAQTFQAKRGVEFEQATRLSDGNINVEYREDTKASAGKKAQLEIPEVFELGLTPYEGSERYKVVARFRYRLVGPSLSLGFKLDNPHKILREAFTDIAGVVEEKTIELGCNFYHGRGR